MVQKVSRICLIYRCYILPQIHFGDYMNFKRFIFSVLAAIVLISNNVYAIEKPVINPNTVDGVLAHVNGKPIMLTDIYPFIPAHRKNIIENNLMPNATPVEIDEHCLFLSLDDAINNRLILDAYYGNPDLNIPQKIIDQRINEIIEKRFDGNRAKLTAELAKNRLTYQAWKTTIEESLIVSAMISGNVVQNIHISNAEIFSEYNANKDKYIVKGTAHLGILQADNADIYTNIVAKLEAKEDFSNIIKELKLNGASSDPAGSIGWVNISEDLTPVFAEPAAALKIGEISSPIEMQGKYYFIKKFDEKAGHEKPFTEVRKEIEAKIFAREMSRLKAEWIKRLRSEAAIEYHIQKH